ncbi:palmitoyltransferase ZDHHC19-like [Sciurus carolinensis]|uniref:palmitoyltransferase ZDHHC19-like n=1 Tax=Sciurus carolinensis TaxID=30640 RepID=UPI001FB54810|nr:palmitoyltransferase ZDHHC19-like [Sciurus carolinensis]
MENLGLDQVCLLAAFIIVLLLNMSRVLFAYPCRWMVGNGECVFALVTGPLFLMTIWSLVLLNISEPGIILRGSFEENPRTAYTAWMNQSAFPMPWCPMCSFHRPPQTFHCPSCNICVEEFDHHCKWANNCVGHRNIRIFMLLLGSLCLYLAVLLVTCVIFLVRTRDLPFSLDKAMAYPHSSKGPHWEQQGLQRGRAGQPKVSNEGAADVVGARGKSQLPSPVKAMLKLWEPGATLSIPLRHSLEKRVVQETEVSGQQLCVRTFFGMGLAVILELQITAGMTNILMTSSGKTELE